MISKKITIMLADDHPLGRQLLASHIEESCDNIEIIGQAINGQELLNLLEKNLPDLVILDLAMPVLDGHKTLRIIRSKYPSIKTIIFSTHYDEYYISLLLGDGAAAFLSKGSYSEEVLMTIKKVYEDGYYFNDKLSALVLENMNEDKKLAYLISEKVLSDREVEVLHLICEGKLYKQVASELKIAVDTVNFHQKNIYTKTQVDTMAALVKYAIRTGITTVH